MTEFITQLRGSVGRRFNWQLFVQDNITGSWFQTAWVLFLTIFTTFYAIGKFNQLPVITIILLSAWVISILMVIIGELGSKHTKLSRWLKENLLSSISNTVLTLFIILLVASALNGIWQWAYVNANFDPVQTAPEFRSEGGATWGVMSGAS